MGVQGVVPEDFGSAGRGDLAALRRLRNYWLQLALGECTNPLIPKEEVLPQLELLSELAAGSGEAEDQVLVIVAYQLRAETLDANRVVAEDLAREAARTNDMVAAAHWSRSAVEFSERQCRLRSLLDALIVAVLNGENAEGAALLVTALTIKADSGDERAVGLLQDIMDAVTPERASAIQHEVRKIEESAQ